MAHRWELVKKAVENESPMVQTAFGVFETTNLASAWHLWSYDAAGVPVLSPTTQIIESWHKTIKYQNFIDTNRIVEKKASNFHSAGCLRCFLAAAVRDTAGNCEALFDAVLFSHSPVS